MSVSIVSMGDCNAINSDGWCDENLSRIIGIWFLSQYFISCLLAKKKLYKSNIFCWQKQLYMHNNVLWPPVWLVISFFLSSLLDFECVGFQWGWPFFYSFTKSKDECHMVKLERSQNRIGITSQSFQCIRYNHIYELWVFIHSALISSCAWFDFHGPSGFKTKLLEQM